MRHTATTLQKLKRPWDFMGACFCWLSRPRFVAEVQNLSHLSPLNPQEAFGRRRFSSRNLSKYPEELHMCKAHPNSADRLNMTQAT